MSGAKNKALILETIDFLKKRRARPDLERICLVLLRKHDLSFADVASDLAILVKERSVLKTEYNGHTSYRNLEKLCNSGSSLSTTGLKTRILENFIQMLKEVSGGQNYKEVSLGAFEFWLTEYDTEMIGAAIGKEQITSAINQLVEDGKLNKSATGMFSINLGEFADINEMESALEKEKSEKAKTIKQSSKCKKSAAAHAENEDFTTSENVSRADSKTPSPGNKKGRPPTKRKRIKKTHGPDFETYIVPSKYSKRRESFEKKEEKVTSSSSKSASSSSSKEERCDFCLMSAECNPKGEIEPLLVCKDCQAKGHPSCMEYSEELARRARSSPWQCIDCKTCCLCDDSGDADAMLFCDACDKGYHMDCHQPQIKDKPTGKWVCTRCMEEDLKKESDMKCSNINGSISGESGSTFLPTPRESPVQVSDFKPNHIAPSTLTSQPRSVKSFLHLMPSFRRLTDKPVPDATDWSIQQVAEYIKEAGFREQAEVFTEQEIDGRSLLLMKRSDVLQGLSIKLGPALKIYAHIQRLQTNGQVIL